MTSCTKCGKGFANRTFTTWPDLGALVEKIVEKGEWEDFIDFCENSYCFFHELDSIKHNLANFMKWAINPTRFRELMDKWLEGKEKA